MSSIPEPTEEERNFLLATYPELPDIFFDACRKYGEFLYKTNETMNLTRIPVESFWSKHVCDSLSVLRVLPELTSDKGKLCDTGCGAGLPSLILAAALPRWSVTAVDSTRKKVDFVTEAGKVMGLKNLHTVHGRANELARKEPFHAVFDFVTARAVADAPVLMRETRQFLKRHGRLVIYRTVSQAEPEIELLQKGGFAVEATPEFELPGGAGHRMFLLLDFDESKKIKR